MVESTLGKTLAPAAVENPAHAPAPRAPSKLSMFDRALVGPAIVDSFRKLDPRVQWRNPVMFVVYIGSIVATALWVKALAGHGEAPSWFILNIAVWLWFTVVFANFAEALAEGRSKAQAAALRGLKQAVAAKKMSDASDRSRIASVRADQLRKGDVVLIEAGDYIPGDGEVIEGAASVDESAITGESAPVIRESGGDFSSVTGGTRVLSDWIIVRITANPGETFIDRMIAMVEERETPEKPRMRSRSTPFLTGGPGAGLPPRHGDAAAAYSLYSVEVAKLGTPIRHHGALRRPVGMHSSPPPSKRPAVRDRAWPSHEPHDAQANVDPRRPARPVAVEAAGDVDVLLLDKTGTITLGNRQAATCIPAAGVTEEELASAAQLASLADETPEGRSVVVLAKQRFNLRERDLRSLAATFVPFSAHTRMSGVDIGERRIRKGAPAAIQKAIEGAGAAATQDHSDHRSGSGPPRQHASVGQRRRPRVGHHRAQGHCQRRYQGALWRIAPHGHQDRDDHG